MTGRLSHLATADFSVQELFLVKFFKQEIPDPSDFHAREKLKAASTSPRGLRGDEYFVFIEGIVRLAEELICRPGYTYEETAVSLGIPFSWDLQSVELRTAEKSIERVWNHILQQPSPAVGTCERELRSYLGVLRAHGMLQNPVIRLHQEISFLDWSYGDRLFCDQLHLPLQPLDEERAYEATYLKEQITLWKAYFLSEGKVLGGAVPIEDALHQQHMELLYCYLEAPLSHRVEFLSHNDFPQWFRERAIKAQYYMLPGLTALNLHQTRSFEAVLALWPPEFVSWLKAKKLYFQQKKRPIRKRIPDFARANGGV